MFQPLKNKNISKIYIFQVAIFSIFSTSYLDPFTNKHCLMVFNDKYSSLLIEKKWKSSLLMESTLSVWFTYVRTNCRNIIGWLLQGDSKIVSNTAEMVLTCF